MMEDTVADKKMIDLIIKRRSEEEAIAAIKKVISDAHTNCITLGSFFREGGKGDVEHVLSGIIRDAAFVVERAEWLVASLSKREGE